MLHTKAVDRIPDEIAHAVLDPRAYAEWDHLHQQLASLRREHPFARGDVEGYDPFWVAAKYEDIQTITLQSDIFLNGITAIQPSQDLSLIKTIGRHAISRSVAQMNKPDHMKHRLLTHAWFQPKNLRPLEDRLRTLAKYYVDRLADAGGECDFVAVAGVNYPLRVIMSILGIPAQDEPMMLRLTQQLHGVDDPEFNSGGEKQTPEERARAMRALSEEAWVYFQKLSEERRRAPSDDVATVIANATIDGKPISDADALGYYTTIAVAGHDTTSSSVAGAIWALAERPEQLKSLKADLSLIPKLVDEAIRWTTPIQHMMRFAACDTQIRDQYVSKGDLVMLSFPSGNRDEEIFDDAFEFRIDRTNNKHIGFGYGPHMCLGMHLAKMEMSIFFQELLPRLESLELAGEPKRMITNFLGGPKYLPIRYRM
jgi:cytochrome P450